MFLDINAPSAVRRRALIRFVRLGEDYFLTDSSVPDTNHQGIETFKTWRLSIGPTGRPAFFSQRPER